MAAFIFAIDVSFEVVEPMAPMLRRVAPARKPFAANDVYSRLE
jgi:hypothetical protein